MSFKIYTAQEFEPLYQARKIDMSESFIIDPQTIGTFQSNNHRENHLKYLFNRTAKYFNDGTKYNVYFDFNKQRWYDENDRDEQYFKYRIIYMDIDPSRCGFQRFEFNIGKDKEFNLNTLKEIVDELEKLSFCVKGGGREDIKDVLYVFHGNQDGFFTHFHRLFHLGK
ncbi:hypothetical protein [Campylobacter sp. JMF_03 NE3]|uniref:hypothetical protein n=1 Tax=Campylobacter sp. JMF_03 NE3 TaxID=2983831 RepID=UPI0022E9E2B3|nr:hypothetical protein [Campylobacter sp. JMF_03 NE3]MDA3053500.1 hypothetical protein [Campylobacter sp. JMF_03 NE3]